MSRASRYRDENGERCVDVRVARVEQLFDNRDPAPFRDRDLDPELAEYLLDAGEDLLDEERIRVVFWLGEAHPAAEIEQSFRTHFGDLIHRLERRRARHRRTGQVSLVLAVVLLAVLLSLARLVGRWIPGSFGAGLKEGLVILSWIVMWRPVEVLLYDWIPVRRERRILARLTSAAVDVRVGDGPTAPSDRARP